MQLKMIWRGLKMKVIRMPGLTVIFLRNDIIPKTERPLAETALSPVNYALKRDGEGRALIDSIAESDFGLVVDVEGRAVNRPTASVGACATAKSDQDTG